MRIFACPTPAARCKGSTTTVNGSAQDRDVGTKVRKTHTSSEEAFRCYSRYLISQGYKQTGSRTFESPDGSILVLDRKSKFGAPMRAGKEASGSKRAVPVKSGGLII